MNPGKEICKELKEYNNMKICKLFLFFIILGCSVEIYAQSSKEMISEANTFVIYRNDIKDITIKTDSLIVKKYDRWWPKSHWDSDTTSYSTVGWYDVAIYLTDDCISRISNTEWNDSLYVMIEDCEYHIGVFRVVENLWLFARPTLYYLSDDNKKFLIRGGDIGFRFIEDFIQEQPCFLDNLLSIQKGVANTQ